MAIMTAVRFLNRFNAVPFVFPPPRLIAEPVHAEAQVRDTAGRSRSALPTLAQQVDGGHRL